MPRPIRRFPWKLAARQFKNGISHAALLRHIAESTNMELYRARLETLALMLPTTPSQEMAA